MKYIEKYGDSEEAAKRFFVNHNDISCEACNITCTWEDVYVDEKGYYLCDDCAMETEVSRKRKSRNRAKILIMGKDGV